MDTLTITTDPTVKSHSTASSKTRQKRDVRLKRIIWEALNSAPDKELQLQELYVEMQRLHPQLKTKRSDWRGTVRHILSSGSYFRRVDNTDRRGVWRIYKDLNSSGGEKDHQQTGEEESSRQSDNETEYESGSRKCSRSSPAAADLVHVAGLFESTNEVLSQPFLFTTSTLHREQTPCDPFNGFARGEIDDLMLSGQPDTFSQSHFHPTNGDHQQSFTQGDIHLNRPALTEHSAYGYPAPFELYAPCYIATSDHHAQMMPFCPPPMPAPPLLDTNAHQGHAPFTALAHALCPDGVPSFWTENDGHAIMTAGLR